MSLDITIEASGIETALKRLDPQNVDRALIIWYDRGTRYVRNELRSRAKGRLKNKTAIKTDGLKPPRWARVYVKSPLARLLEGGTGRFSNSIRGDHWPSTPGIMRATGLPQPEAFLVARAIGERGGNPAQPFIRPTYMAVKGPLVRLAEDVVKEVLG